MIKKLIIIAVAITLRAGVASAQQYSATHSTNVSFTAVQNNHTATNLLVFTPAATRTYYQITVQNTTSNKLSVLWAASTAYTNAVTNALSAATILAPAGTVGDKVTYFDVFPRGLSLIAETSTLAADKTIDGAGKIEALGR
jgi:hypothetical protein